MKTRQDLIKEYGMIIRWINGGGDEAGNTWGYRYFIENCQTKGTTEITDQEAISYIGKTTLPVFRNASRMYDAHVGLFGILGIQKRGDA